VTVTISIDRKQVWTLPSNAIQFQGGQDYFVSLKIDGKPVRTAVIIGPSDDAHTEILRKYVPGDPRNPPLANTVDWPTFDGTEQVLVGNLDVIPGSQADSAKSARKP
jgi:hypothetical protein